MYSCFSNFNKLTQRVTVNPSSSASPPSLKPHFGNIIAWHHIKKMQPAREFDIYHISYDFYWHFIISSTFWHSPGSYTSRNKLTCGSVTNDVGFLGTCHLAFRALWNLNLALPSVHIRHGGSSFFSAW